MGFPESSEHEAWLEFRVRSIAYASSSSATPGPLRYGSHLTITQFPRHWSYACDLDDSSLTWVNPVAIGADKIGKGVPNKHPGGTAGKSKPRPADFRVPRVSFSPPQLIIEAPTLPGTYAMSVPAYFKRTFVLPR